jgi:hypothetical protein
VSLLAPRSGGWSFSDAPQAASTISTARAERAGVAMPASHGVCHERLCEIALPINRPFVGIIDTYFYQAVGDTRPLWGYQFDNLNHRRSWLLSP